MRIGKALRYQTFDHERFLAWLLYLSIALAVTNAYGGLFVSNLTTILIICGSTWFFGTAQRQVIKCGFHLADSVVT
jgi:hypothetical protein